MSTRAHCDGCLGTLQCWICTGEGCHRCSTGACHVCGGSRLRHLLPQQAGPREELAVPQR